MTPIKYKTLIECFDRSVNANIVGCLHLRPEKVVFIGDSEKMRGAKKQYEEIFERQKLRTTVKTESVHMHHMDQIADTLFRLVRQEAPCVIDVTGGDERLLMAVGIVLSKLDPELRKQVAIQKFDKETGLAQDCDGDGRVVSGYPVNITAVELIRLHQGRASSDSSFPRGQYRAKDLDPLWKIVCKKSDSWNNLMSALIYAESRVPMEQRNKGNIYLPAETLTALETNHTTLDKAKALLKDFRDAGVIKGRLDEDCWDYHYTSSLFRCCTAKQGNILEVKTLLEAQEVLENGAPYFYDCVMGVDIFWENPDPVTGKTTHNEVDLVLTRGLTPLFISCKNGETDENELYKLDAVANHFGRPDAKKMLVATNLKLTNKKSIDSFIQRADDMGIHLITQAKNLEKEDWRNAFKAAFRKQSY